jgi:fluoroacetyl-CoA thioesterase
MRPVPVGARAEREQIVKFENTLEYHYSYLPPVYATPEMIGLMETAAFFALQPYCDEGEITVGTVINIEHRAASIVGARIRAEASLESSDGKFFTLRVRAFEVADDGTEKVEIGRGTVGRAVVDKGKFLSRLQQNRSAKPA